MLRQAENIARIEGILSEVDIKPISYVNKTTGANVDALSGRITIRVNETINGAPSVLEVPVHVFAPKLTKDNRPNPAYDNIGKLTTDFTSIAAAGNEMGADCIRVSRGTITMNEFYNQSGQLVSSPRIQSSFFTKIKKEECKPCATFSVEFAIANMADEVDREGNVTGRLKISGIVPQYGGKVDVVPFYAASPNVVNAISQYWHPQETVKAVGKINFSFTTRTIKEEVDFGDPVERTVTTSVNELILTGGTQEPLDETTAFDVGEITKALADRKTRLEAQKESDMSKAKTKATPAPTTTAKGGFDVGF